MENWAADKSAESFPYLVPIHQKTLLFWLLSREAGTCCFFPGPPREKGRKRLKWCPPRGADKGGPLLPTPSPGPPTIKGGSGSADLQETHAVTSREAEEMPVLGSVAAPAAVPVRGSRQHALGGSSAQRRRCHRSSGEEASPLTLYFKEAPGSCHHAPP